MYPKKMAVVVLNMLGSQRHLDLNSTFAMRQTCGIFHFPEPRFATTYNGNNNKASLLELGLYALSDVSCIYVFHF